MGFKYAASRWEFDDDVALNLDVRLYLHINDVAVTLTRADKALKYWQHLALVQWVGVNQEHLRRSARRNDLQGYGMAPSGYAA